jgi:hypothetical protein
MADLFFLVQVIQALGAEGKHESKFLRHSFGCRLHWAWRD